MLEVGDSLCSPTGLNRQGSREFLQIKLANWIMAYAYHYNCFLCTQHAWMSRFQSNMSREWVELNFASHCKPTHECLKLNADMVPEHSTILNANDSCLMIYSFGFLPLSSRYPAPHRHSPKAPRAQDSTGFCAHCSRLRTALGPKQASLSKVQIPH